MFNAITSYEFANPGMLWLLLALPLLAIWLGRRGQAAAVQYSSVETVRRLGASRRTRAGAFLTSLRLLTLACVIVALARPQEVERSREIEASGVDLMLAVDISRSMMAEDLTVRGERLNRLEVVKRVMEDFIRDRPNDRIGIVAFGGKAYLMSPVTLDHDWLLRNFERLQISSKADGTAIGMGLAASVQRLRDEKAKSKVVILLTDGVNNQGEVSPLMAAEAAKTLGIKVYTIAAGKDGIVQVPVQGGFFNQSVPVQAEVDEETLKEIAAMTGGKFYRAQDAESLMRIYDEIDQLEKTEAKVHKYQQFDELFYLALLPAFLLMGLEVGLANTRLRRLP
ncbi:MAG: VWA domain-containing protein [Verrucomicrobiota bacterium]